MPSKSYRSPGAHIDGAKHVLAAYARTSDHFVKEGNLYGVVAETTAANKVYALQTTGIFERAVAGTLSMGAKVYVDTTNANVANTNLPLTTDITVTTNKVHIGYIVLLRDTAAFGRTSDAPAGSCYVELIPQPSAA